MRRILLAEDDQKLGETLKENLELEGFVIEWHQNGLSALQAAHAKTFDLIVLDVMLPEMNGFEILEAIRKKNDVPVFLISAKATSSDRIQGLELQADDYLVKPFHLKEFLLRVYALLRRERRSSLAENEIVIGRATVDFKAFRIRSEQTEEILTAKECGVLKLLARNANSVISRDELLAQVWGEETYPSTRTIDNIMVKLRRLIEIDPSNPRIILSHRGVGYSLNWKKAVTK